MAGRGVLIPGPVMRRPSLLLRRLFLLFVLVATVSLVLLAASTDWLAAFGGEPEGSRLERMQRSPRFFDGAFTNPAPTTTMAEDADTLALLKQQFFGAEQRTPPFPLPLHDPRPTLAKPPATGLRITWLGHSTLFVELDGAKLLTDPMFGLRASPSTLVGPARFHAPPLPLEALPRADAVLISHDHYDHLDMHSIRALDARGLPFIVPLGVGAHLEAWGVAPEKITELEWWEETAVPGTDVTLVATPSQHFSGRALHDGNRTLWTSWVLKGPSHRAYFSGDTGLAPEFPEIARREGPFDVVALEVGAYHPSWGAIHLGPDQALTAHAQLGGGALLPIHWGTFNLALHGWSDPMERLYEEALARGVPLLTPQLGAPIEPNAAPAPSPWWRNLVQGPLETGTALE